MQIITDVRQVAGLCCNRSDLSEVTRLKAALERLKSRSKQVCPWELNCGTVGDIFGDKMAK